ncbi:hypothetical protein UA44_24950, partial [Klebsiella aerogenes]
YLQLCAEQNMQVCVPSTPAQVYHMLRRQALRGMRRPLVVMSPKSLLRHPLAVSSMDELANGTFMPAIGEIDELDPQAVNASYCALVRFTTICWNSAVKTSKKMSPSCVSNSSIRSRIRRYRKR